MTTKLAKALCLGEKVWMDLYRLGKGDIYEATTKGSATNGYLVQISNHNLVAYKKATSMILID